MKIFLVLAAVMVTMLACSFSVVNDLIPSPTSSFPTSSVSTGGTPGAENINSVMDRIQQQVVNLRGLQPVANVNRALLTPDELHQKVINDFFGDYTAEDQATDQRELALLGLLESNFDLHQFYVDLYSEQVAGYYDPETKEMYVISGETFNGPERMTYAHEYMHVLQDQVYDMEQGMKVNDEYCEDHTEYCAAVSALFEGDATLTEALWFWTDATDEERQQVQNMASAVYPVYESAPDYMKQDFMFPYDQGYSFVESIYQRGDFQAVDQVYKDPPVTTEQIIHPEGYPADVPLEIPLIDFTSVLGTGWQEVRRNVMGEWYTYLILAYGRETGWRLDDQTAKNAATGWGGDTYLVYWNADLQQSVFIMRSQWDTMQDANEFWNAMIDYSRSRWGDSPTLDGNTYQRTGTEDGFVTIQRNGNNIIWLITPDGTIASKMIAAIPGY